MHVGCRPVDEPTFLMGTPTLPLKTYNALYRSTPIHLLCSLTSQRRTSNALKDRIARLTMARRSISWGRLSLRHRMILLHCLTERLFRSESFSWHRPSKTGR